MSVCIFIIIFWKKDKKIYVDRYSTCCKAKVNTTPTHIKGLQAQQFWINAECFKIVFGIINEQKCMSYFAYSTHFVFYLLFYFYQSIQFGKLCIFI